MLQDGVAPYGCLTDPLLDTGRYVYVRCALPTLLALARGRQGDGQTRSTDGSLTATGETDLCRRVPEWFAPLAAPIASAAAPSQGPGSREVWLILGFSSRTRSRTGPQALMLRHRETGSFTERRRSSVSPARLEVVEKEQQPAGSDHAVDLSQAWLRGCPRRRWPGC